MTVSGQTIYELSRNTIIESALRKIGALGVGQTPVAEAYTNGQIALNSLISTLQGVGMTIWKRSEVSVPLVEDTRSYAIGEDQTVDTPFLIRLESAVIAHDTSGTRQELEIKGKYEFNLLNTVSTGQPTSILYTPKVNMATLEVWPMPDATAAADYTIKLNGRIAFYGFTSASETPDFPQEWANTLIYGTAISLAPEYGTPLADRKALKEEYVMWLDLAVGSTQPEDESVFFGIRQR
jgi:hypothetical protein